jgi:1-acyl-sn-glycerol-3-phosphate acyltransferase
MCAVLCQLLFRIRVYGLQNIPAEGPFLLLSNHQSFLDPVLCGARLPRPLCYVARDSLFTIPVFSVLIRSLNVIPIKRNQADISAIRQIVQRLKTGWGVGLFPEATRSRDGRISVIKPGIGLLSRRTDAPVVPVVIDGAFECWPRHRKIFSAGRVTVCFGKPIPASQVRQTSNADFAEYLTATLRKMQNQCRVSLGKRPYEYPAGNNAAPGQ